MVTIVNSFPEEYELLDLFESEPIIYDLSTPFFYNNLIYKLIRSNGTLKFEVEPGSHWARVTLTQGEIDIIDLELNHIKSVEIEKRNNQEFIHLSFHKDQDLKKLVLKTKPEFSMTWGTDRDCTD